MSSTKKGTAIQISACRICGNSNLIRVVDLGQQWLTGAFPKEVNAESITKGPLALVKCHSESSQVCGLLQLEHNYCLEELYGENYGYRSGLNKQMVQHLQEKISKITSICNLKQGDLVIDIGANDGTSLGFYPDNLDLVGIDPTASKFKQHYKSHINIIADFFSSEKVRQYNETKKAKVITSFSMLYDLEEPLKFAKEIHDVLDPDDGIWCFEQSYMPSMIDQMAFDTICHEHLEYYGLQQIEWMLENANLKIIDVEFNDVNGGSFSVIASNKQSHRTPNLPKIQEILQKEMALKLHTLDPYIQFATKIDQICKELKSFVRDEKNKNKRFGALGASTKGNVLLQRCSFSTDQIEAVGEVNPEKYGAYTPGTWIPIIPESKLLADDFDYLIVLPWHFKEFFLNSPAFKKQTLIFPLPKLEIVHL